MGSDYPVVRLGDHVEACLGKMLDAQKNRGELQPYLGNSNVRWGTFDLEELALMRFEDHEDLRYGIRDGDLIVCEGGEPGRCAIWRGDSPMKIQKALHRVRTKAGLDNYFLYYWFLRAGITGELEPFFTGTTIKHLTGKALAELRISLPPIGVQREVAGVLRSLDDKIALNHRINQTLEIMVQAIFKSWFVDFTPVKAKIAALAEGRDPLRAAMSAITGKSDSQLDSLPPQQYGQLTDTAALFPDQMEKSGLGEIPRQWKTSTIGEECAYLNRGISPKYLEEGGVLVLNQKCVRNFSVDPSKGRRHDSTQRAVNGRLLQVGDVLVNSTGVGTLGRVAQVLRLDEPTIVDSHLTVVRAGSRLNSAFLGQWFVIKQPEIETFGEGSTGQTELSRVKIAIMDVLVPDEPALAAFDAQIAPLKSLISSNEYESMVLRQTRDAFLAKLLSWKLAPAIASEVAKS